MSATFYFSTGWDLLLDMGEASLVSITASEQAPASGFRLIQTDLDTGSQLFISSEMRILAVLATPILPLLLFGLCDVHLLHGRRRRGR